MTQFLNAIRNIKDSAKQAADTARIQTFIEQSGTCTMSEIARKFRGITSQSRQKILDQLIQQDLIDVDVTYTQGRPVVSVRWK